MRANAAGTNPGTGPGTRLNDWGRDLCSGGDYHNQTLENNNGEWELCVLCHEWIFSLTKPIADFWIFKVAASPPVSENRSRIM
jgi:hypothetical protein